MKFDRPARRPFALVDIVAWVVSVLTDLPLLDSVVFARGAVPVRRASLDNYEVHGRVLDREEAARVVVLGTERVFFAPRTVEGNVPPQLMLARLYPAEYGHVVPKAFRRASQKRWANLHADRLAILAALKKLGEGLRAEEMQAVTRLSEKRIWDALNFCQAIGELVDINDRGFFTSAGLEKERVEQKARAEARRAA